MDLVVVKPFGRPVEMDSAVAKLFERPVEMDSAKEKAFTAARYAFPFQIFLRILFLDLEVRFFGTAIMNNIFSYLVRCEGHLCVYPYYIVLFEGKTLIKNNCPVNYFIQK